MSPAPRSTPVNLPLEQLSVAALPKMDPQTARLLTENLGIDTVQDLLFHLPMRYEDRTRISPIAELTAAGKAVIVGQVLRCDEVYRGRRSLSCEVADDSGILRLRFFNHQPWLRRLLQPGARVRCFGELRSQGRRLEMSHPEVHVLRVGEPEAEQCLSPVYPSTAGLNQYALRRATAAALRELAAGGLSDWLPTPPQLGGSGSDLAAALRYLHAPPPDAPLTELEAGRHPCQRRLAFEELLAHRLSLLQVRRAVRSRTAPALPPAPALQTALRDEFGFELTAAQERVATEIAGDLSRAVPMLRLLQGDVGSGKTAVAALAAVQAIAAGCQVAIMAPTEILAEQHLLSFERWLGALQLRVISLTRRARGQRRKKLLSELATGDAVLAVGTHALLQEDVRFAQLGLVVIDEQHRFGVHQRLTLSDKGSDAAPHQLIMTATPIPRTLTMSAYSDLDCSVIDELPPGRQPVGTVLIGESRRDAVMSRVRAACAAGRQAYWICTLVEESENLQCQAAEETAARLRKALPELQIGLVHGRHGVREKAAVMRAFRAGETALLVATTVVEVGVDVPSASLMVIENPERLGLSQLHQLRGRIGRGAEQSHCVLLYGSPLSANARTRLEAIRDHHDGFVIAERDLELRGPGEVLGTRQTGIMQFRIAELRRDLDLQPEVRRYAAQLMREHPESVAPLVRRWLGEKARYGAV